MTNKRPRPVAACDVCGAVALSVPRINDRCSVAVAKRRCPGIYRATEQWIECTTCRASGMINQGRCEACRGSGWLCQHSG